MLLGCLCVWSMSGRKSNSADSSETTQKRKSNSGASETAADDRQPDTSRKSGKSGSPADAPPLAVVPFSVRDAKQHQGAWARYLKIPVEQTNGMGMEFRLIPAGEFKMGLTEKQDQGLRRLCPESRTAGWDSAKPQHAVRLTQPFYMGVHEIRYGEFFDLLQRMPGNIPREEWMTDAAAITRGATWYDAVEFCNALSTREKLSPCYRVDGDNVEMVADGNGYRLPTEAEWEFACRAGTETVWFYGFDPQDHVQNPKSGMRTHRDYAGDSYSQSNPFGLVGMYAGSDEWCWDGFVPYAASVVSPGQVVENPMGHPVAAQRVKRGGASWSGGGNDLSSINSAARSHEDPKSAGPWTGLGRVVLAVASQRPGQPSGSQVKKGP